MCFAKQEKHPLKYLSRQFKLYKIKLFNEISKISSVNCKIKTNLNSFIVSINRLI